MKHLWHSLKNLVKINPECRTRQKCLSFTSQLIQQVSDYFSGDLLVLSSQGISSIIMFHEKASTLLKVNADEEDGDKLKER